VGDHSRSSGRWSRHRDRRGAGRLRRQKKDGRQRSAINISNIYSQVCWTFTQSDQNLRGPHVARQRHLSIDVLPAPVLSSKPADERPPPLLL